MASSLSAFSFYNPFSSERITASSRQSKFLATFTPCRARPNSIRASAEGKDNLDHLQRAAQTTRKTTPQVAPVGLWDRFPAARTVQQMMDTMERVLEDPLTYSTGTWPPVTARERNGYKRGRTPWDIKEREEDYKVRFDMPGMMKNDVKVYVEEHMLVVKAEKAPKSNSKDAEEWDAESFGKYSTRIALPENVELEKITAEVKDGVLYITIPKASPTSKIVDINVQ